MPGCCSPTTTASSRKGLKTLLAAEFDLVGVVEDGRALIAAAKTLRPDVIVSDITMPNLNGIEALEELKKIDPGVRMIFLTMHRDVVYARRALEAGACGFVLKHSAPEELIMAVRAALEGRTFITPILAGEVLDAMRHGPAQVVDQAATLTLRQRRDPASARRGTLGQANGSEARNLAADGGVSQIPDDGKAGRQDQ